MPVSLRHGCWIGNSTGLSAPTADIHAPAPRQDTVNIPAAHAPNGRSLARLNASLKP